MPSGREKQPERADAIAYEQHTVTVTIARMKNRVFITDVLDKDLGS